MDYCDVFISCFDSHFDGTHSLQMIRWWASDVMLNFPKSVLMTKQTYLHLGWPGGVYIFSKFSFKRITVNMLLRVFTNLGNRCCPQSSTCFGTINLIVALILQATNLNQTEMWSDLIYIHLGVTGKAQADIFLTLWVICTGLYLARSVETSPRPTIFLLVLLENLTVFCIW